MLPQVCFRTFGKDLPKLAAEYNALCEGTHPLFPGRVLVLDGTDGQPDMRMDLSPAGCGTRAAHRRGRRGDRWRLPFPPPRRLS